MLRDEGRWSVIMHVAGDRLLEALELCERCTYDEIAAAYVTQMARTMGVGYSLPD